MYRSVVNGGDHSECYVKKCKVEVHPLMLKLCVYPETDVLTREFSTTTTIGTYVSFFLINENWMEI